MMVAVMAQIVTMLRRRPGTALGAGSSVGDIAGQSWFATAGEKPSRLGERTAMVGVDRDIDAHAGLQLLDELVVGIEIDPHRHALHHLDEVAGGVLRRQDRELRAGSGRERADRALEHMVRERIDVERDGLADRDIGEIAFLRIGVDPGVGDVDDGEHRRAGGDEAAELDLVDLGRDPRHRRAQHGVIEIALRHAERRLGLGVGRELLQRQVGIAEQLRLRIGKLLLDELGLRARGHHRIRRIVEVELRADIALDQRLFAIDVALLQVDRLLRQIEHLAVDFDVGDQIVIGGPGLLELCLGLVDRKLERHRDRSRTARRLH